MITLDFFGLVTIIVLSIWVGYIVRGALDNWNKKN